MEKVTPAAVAFAIFIHSAAAEPIKMPDGELELIHGGAANSSIEITSIYPDGSAIVIQNGVEYRIAPGSIISLPDGTQVQITQNSNGYSLLVINDRISISQSLSGSGVTANEHILLKTTSSMDGTGTR